MQKANLHASAVSVSRNSVGAASRRRAQWLALLLLTLLLPQPLLAAKSWRVSSPDKRLTAIVSLNKGTVTMTVADGRTTLIPNILAGLRLADGTTTFADSRAVKSTVKHLSDDITAPLYRQAAFHFEANRLDLLGRDGLGLQVVVANEGVAYRFYTTRQGETIVRNETARYHFDTPPTDPVWLSYSTNDKKPLAMAFQNIYDVTNLYGGSPEGKKLAFLPATVSVGNTKVTLLESDVRHYPSMWVQAGDGELMASFAPYPKRMDYYPWRHMSYVADTEDYIAKSVGPRTYPWRVFEVTRSDTDMPVTNMVYALAEPNKIGDTKWIRPGKVSWDWWSDWNLRGVPFRAGINTATYKYYIDFAAKYHLEYIILDEGWYDSARGDLMHPIKDVDLPELISYARQKGVGIILWTVFNVLDEQLEEACRHYAGMGVKGFKVDFMDRNDQTAADMVERIADACARHHLVLDLHGIYTPTGLDRTYPNILNYESVFGMEEVKWGKLENNHPLYDVTFPFIRMQAGRVDFTPGAMRNGTQKDWLASYTKPMSQGTRCHQAAEYIVYDSPLTMLADVPTNYEREPAYTAFLAALPTVFDKTTIPQAKLGEYIVTLRQKGNIFYLGGLTSWTPRDVQLPLSFLPKGITFKASILSDGPNADRDACDYTLSSQPATAADSLSLHLAPGGGFVVVLAPATR